MNNIPPGLYAITHQLQGSALKKAVTAALTGGANGLMYRDKTQDNARRLEEAQMLKALCAEYNVPFVINDDALLAKAVNASGVHLGQQDGSLGEARHLLGPEAIIGITCHNSLELAEQAIAGGANYVSFGACFPSPSKPEAVCAELTTITEARKQFQVPIVAIGGITVANARAVLAAGAHSLAVINGVFGADDIQACAAEFTKIIREFNP